MVYTYFLGEEIMNTEKRKEYGLKQLNIEVPEDIKTQIYKAAERRNISIRLWVHRALVKALNDEK